MTTPGSQKIWIVLNRSHQNAAHFVNVASSQVVDAGIAGNVEEGDDPCPVFHLPKTFSFGPKWLIENGIGFEIILQGFNDIVVPDTQIP